MSYVMFLHFCRVVLGEYDNERYEGPEQYISVKEIIKHPWDIDVAIIVLEREAELNDRHYRIIELARDLPEVGKEVTAMGWGWTEHDTRSPSEVLQFLDLPVANNSDCDAPPDELGVKNYELCCGRNQSSYTNICHGDSGGPLVSPGNSSHDSEVVQVGIAVRGNQGCSAHYIHAAFVSVPHPDVFNWIACVTDFISKDLVIYCWARLRLAQQHLSRLLKFLMLGSRQQLIIVCFTINCIFYCRPRFDVLFLNVYRWNCDRYRS